MPAGTKVIQRRIKSVSNTKKITKAMEMVAAAKMRKATASVLGTRPYSSLAWQIIGNIGKIKEEGIHPLLAAKEKKSKKSMVILIASDKGLCGGFNAQMFREIKNFIRSRSVIPAPFSAIPAKHALDHDRGAGIQTLDFVVLGKKGEAFASREKLSIAAVFENLTNNPKFTDVKPIAKMAMDKFIDGTYDRVYAAYTDYVSTLAQKPAVRQLLPIIKDEDLGAVSQEQKNAETLKQENMEYLFEPEKNELLEMLLPKIVETQVFQAVLESVASEHSARMVAMKNATDAAKDMVDDLRFAYNKIRQAGITREISEISAGKAALE